MTDVSGTKPRNPIGIAALALAAIVLGIIGLVQPARPRGAAAAGLALGAAALVGLVTTPIAGAILQVAGS